MAAFSIPKLRHLALVFAMIAGAALIAGEGHSRLLSKLNAEKMDGLAQQVVAGAEKAIDYAILSIFELDAIEADLCSEAGLKQIQQAVHLRSVVKDVRVLAGNGEVRCSAFPGMISPANQTETLGNAVASRNPAYALTSVTFGGRRILGVMRKAEDEVGLLVLIDVETQLFSALPREIREDAFGALRITDQDAVAFTGRMPAPDAQIVSTRAHSTRFPVGFDISLSAQAFAQWDRNFHGIVTALGGLLGGIFGALILRELRRPKTQRQELADALENGEIQPYFQPILCAKTATLTSCEVLVRWIKSDGTVVSPAQFIPLAESSGLIVPMTRKLMQMSFEQLRGIMSQNPKFAIAFNITPTDFAAQGFVSEILAVATKAKVDPRQITLEITEREGFADISVMGAAVVQAKQAGFCVSLDDTGTGHNGLSHIQDIAADVIKIDKKFVDFVGISPSADAIIEMLVGLARRLSMKTVAEGVETTQQMLALHKAGVDCFQGYLISKPLNAVSFNTYYRDFNTPEAAPTPIVRTEPVDLLPSLAAA